MTRRRRRRKLQQQQPAISDLPEDIMIEILLRLPLDSIKTLNCVSRRWKSVIERPDFVHRYTKSNKVTTFTCNDGLYCLSVVKITKDRRRYPRLIVRRIQIENKSWVWAMNGMACFDQYKGNTLFRNLLTGTSYNWKTPELRLTNPWKCFGLSYDAHDSDYKMMLQNKDNGLFWVYSFNSLVWKILEGFPYGEYEWGPLWNCCSLNGVIHWTVTTKNDPVKMAIVTYDIHTCTFGEMPVPAVDHEYNVMDLGGELCLWMENGRGVIDLWVMKEYGVKDSWTRLARIDKWKRFTNKWIAPVTQCERTDGRRFLLFISRKVKSLYWYDIQNNSVRALRKSSWMRERVI